MSSSGAAAADDAAWVADPRIGWRILLAATGSALAAVDDDQLTRRLAALAAANGWPVTTGMRRRRDPATLRRELTGDLPDPVVLGRTGVHDDALTISAHHSAVDGLGLLTVLAALTGTTPTSSARGVGERPVAGGLGSSALRRLGESLLRPPARPVPARGATAPTDPTGDVVAERTVETRIGTADLVHAGAAALAGRSPRRRASRHVAVAVGASREGMPRAGAPIRDRSVLIRLRDVERMDRAGVAAAVRSAPLEPSPTGAGAPLSALARGALSVGLRVLGPRLGSSLLVSHLGQVEAPGIDRLTFCPVTGGGSGLSLGAVGTGRGTVITLRGRATTWDDDGLEQLLEPFVARL